MDEDRFPWPEVGSLPEAEQSRCVRHWDGCGRLQAHLFGDDARLMSVDVGHRGHASRLEEEDWVSDGELLPASVAHCDYYAAAFHEQFRLSFQLAHGSKEIPEVERRVLDPHGDLSGLRWQGLTRE